MNQSFIHTVVQSGDIDLAVRFYDNPGRDAVILLHGGPGVPDEMTEVVEILKRKLRIINFDQRGTGNLRCRKCSYAISEYIADVSRIADHFKLSRFFLFGHSWGGLYAQLYAQAHPERIQGLFLCSPASGSGPRIWKMTEREVLAYNRQQATLVQWIGMGLNTLLSLLGSDRACRRVFYRVICNYNKGFTVPAPEMEKLAKVNAVPVNRTRREIKNYKPLKDFGSTPYPVMITYGDKDICGPSREFTLARFAEARVNIIPSCGHTPWKHNLPAFAGLLEVFFG